MICSKKMPLAALQQKLGDSFDHKIDDNIDDNVHVYIWLDDHILLFIWHYCKPGY